MVVTKKMNHQVRERILLVDDEQVILDLLKRVLTREGYQVTTTPHGEEAVDLMSAERFDLAIVDVGLDCLDGRRLMKIIRRLSPEVAIVAMTGYPEEAVLSAAQEYAQGYLEKPFALEELLAVVRGALERRVECGEEARGGCSLPLRPPREGREPEPPGSSGPGRVSRGPFAERDGPGPTATLTGYGGIEQQSRSVEGDGAVGSTGSLPPSRWEGQA